MKVEVYMKLYEKYLRDVEELYAKGGLAQAGEKYWGATTALLNIIGERRGWSHYTHKDCAEIMGRLSEELKGSLAGSSG